MINAEWGLRNGLEKLRRSTVQQAGGVRNVVRVDVLKYYIGNMLLHSCFEFKLNLFRPELDDSGLTFY